MIRHRIRRSHYGRAIVVVAGYDRPLRRLFLQVLRCCATRTSRSTCADDILHDRLHEPALDWSAIDTLTDKFAALGIVVPESLIEDVHLDPRFNAGNRVVRHHADQLSEVLRAG